MRALAEVATAHADDRLSLVETVADEAARAWRAVDARRIVESWLSRMVPLMVVLAGAQQVAAGGADGYLNEALDVQGIDPAAAARVVPAALSGIASDGRGLDGLLYRPVAAALDLIRGGTTAERALASGGFLLDMIVRTQVADSGRVADQIATTARPQATGYTRVLVGRSCSRCALLAGRWYRHDAGFNRHPRCDCVGAPGRLDTAGDLRVDPKAYFASLGREEQDRVFTAAGAQAIRDGADVSRTVNAARGTYTASDGRKYTMEAAGRRPRLLPDAIYREARGDRDEALRLLSLHGYLAP